MTIKNSIILFVLITLSFSGLSLFSVFDWTQGAAPAGKVINIAGRQRMLTQRITKDVLLMVSGVPTRESINTNTQLFESSLNALLLGDANQGIVATEDPAIISALEEVKTLWGPYQETLNRVLISGGSDPLVVQQKSLFT